MKKAWAVALSAVVGALSMAAPSQADEPSVTYSQPNRYDLVAPPNRAPAVIVQQGSGCAACAGEQAAPVKPKKTAMQKFKGFFDGEGCGCNPNSEIGCSTWKQEYQFIFGSCRNFFGDPCFKTPEQLLQISEGEYYGRTNPGINRVNRAYP